jgi:cytochrome d ubiquinol oxidase subunit I
MDTLFDHVTLSRIQFAVTAHFHILWPVLTVGLSLFIVLMEALYHKTGDKRYYDHCRFWTRIFVLNFSVGVVTGIPMEFQFGTNWSLFSAAGGDSFGHMLGFEAAMAFMLEAVFLGIMVFGWERVSPRLHLFAASMVALGGSLSVFWIMAANSWMHTPAGGIFQNGHFVITSQWGAILNPDTPFAVSHMWVACIEVSLFAVGGLSAWYILMGRHTAFFLKSFKIAVITAILITPIQIWLGDASGIAVFKHQPAKLAAIEAHWETNPPGQGAPEFLLAWPNQEKQKNDWEIGIPNGLSLIATRSFTGTVKGLKEFPRRDQPPVFPIFYSFRIMAGIGALLLFLMVWTLWAWRRGDLSEERIAGRKLLLCSWIAAAPLGYLAMETGWMTREIGRQPWVIYNLLRTADSATPMTVGPIVASLLTLAVVYPLLFILFLVFARRIIVTGPDLETSVGGR